MNPSYLNPSASSFPFVDLNGGSQHLEPLISPPQHATPSISSPINYFNLNQEYQTGSHSRESLQNEKKVEKIVLFGGSSDRRAISSSSFEPTAGDMVCKREDHEDEGKITTSDDGSIKWMSSKMRVMRKMMNSNKDKPVCRVVHKFNDDQINSTNYNSNDFVRVCSDCNTTKTPLWRGGPQGPKSLCNACGIRQRKARRAMALAAAAANGTELNTETSTSTKMQNKEKKSRTSYIAKNKQHFKLLGTNSAHTSEKQLSFEDFALSWISKKNFTFRDEEEAAILLMALSCGLIYS